METDLAPAAVTARVEPHLLAPRERVVVVTIDEAADWHVHGGGEGDPAAEWFGRRVGR